MKHTWDLHWWTWWHDDRACLKTANAKPTVQPVNQIWHIWPWVHQVTQVNRFAICWFPWYPRRQVMSSKRAAWAALHAVLVHSIQFPLISFALREILCPSDLWDFMETTLANCAYSAQSTHMYTPKCSPMACSWSYQPSFLHRKKLNEWKRNRTLLLLKTCENKNRTINRKILHVTCDTSRISLWVRPHRGSCCSQHLLLLLCFLTIDCKKLQPDKIKQVISSVATWRHQRWKVTWHQTTKTSMHT